MIRVIAPFCKLLIVGVFILCMKAYSQQAGELSFYKSEIPVREQSASSRREAAQQGLQNVIVRMSGSSHILEHSAIASALSRVEQFVLQSQYVRLDDPLLIEQGFSQKASFLFSPERVRELLLTNNLPYWPTTRPQTLVWVVEDSQELGKQFLSADLPSVFLDTLSDAAKKAGTPLVYPLLDIDDLLSLSPEQVWRLDAQAILAASEKYDADVVLTGRLSQTSQGTVLSSLEVLHRGDAHTIDMMKPNYVETASAVIENMAQWLSGIYAIKQSEQAGEQVFISVTDITQFGQYSQVLDYLRGLALASRVSVIKVEGDALLLGIMTDVSIDKIATTLTLDRRIESLSSVDSVINSQNTRAFDRLRYDPNRLNNPSLGAPVPNAIADKVGSYLNPLVYRWLGN